MCLSSCIFHRLGAIDFCKCISNHTPKNPGVCCLERDPVEAKNYRARGYPSELAGPSKQKTIARLSIKNQFESCISWLICTPNNRNSFEIFFCYDIPATFTPCSMWFPIRKLIFKRANLRAATLHDKMYLSVPLYLSMLKPKKNCHGRLAKGTPLEVFPIWM